MCKKKKKAYAILLLSVCFDVFAYKLVYFTFDLCVITIYSFVFPCFVHTLLAQLVLINYCFGSITVSAI